MNHTAKARDRRKAQNRLRERNNARVRQTLQESGIPLAPHQSTRGALKAHRARITETLTRLGVSR